MFMKPKFCFDHKNKYMVNIRKNIYYALIIIYHILKKPYAPECKI